MSLLQQLKDYRRTLFYTVLMLVLLSNLTMFYSVKSAKVMFYWAFYFSLLGVICDFHWLKKRHWWVIAPIALLGASDLIWFAWIYIGNPDFDEYNGYLNAGKRLILAAIIGYYLLSVVSRYHEISRSVIRVTLILTFIVASGVGIYQHLYIPGRVDFFLGRATNAAYDYSILSAALIFLLVYENINRKTMFCSLLIFAVSYYIIFQTGTRNVMATYPLLIIFVGIVKLRHLGFKPLIFVVLCITAVATLSYQQVIKPKFDATRSEFSRYESTNGNVDGSLTSRLAMWNIGINLITDHPLGNSLEQRWSYAQEYVKEHNADKSGLPYIQKVHLHNEVIEIASLLGVQGAMVLLFYYFSLLGFAYYTRNPPLFAVMMGLIVCGLTDVLLLSREQAIMLNLLIISLVLWHNDRLPSSDRE
ncbi:O-antigen ligase family protein [Erwiniaceae bacterium BAC15a-03b]|uniref:O-antigen ligase family protein n=1 Tax=Winslowiella arboricola TaxID=2978220 RepID=A0A9J6PR61_9GAMM|nr:O-antigen ligase family protein [Winslowiella arboricola]MCU5773537.1 O-antigen ligase family protein [Winslowiella arboricola]MCU5776551.1 O-antigen ligase family protein [Winslowiella arboricola]